MFRIRQDPSATCGAYLKLPKYPILYRLLDIVLIYCSFRGFGSKPYVVIGRIVDFDIRCLFCGDDKGGPMLHGRVRLGRELNPRVME